MLLQPNDLSVLVSMVLLCYANSASTAGLPVLRLSRLSAAPTSSPRDEFFSGPMRILRAVLTLLRLDLLRVHSTAFAVLFISDVVFVLVVILMFELVLPSNDKSVHV